MPAPIVAAYDPFAEDRAPVELALAAAELTGAGVVAAAVFVSPSVGGLMVDPYMLSDDLQEMIDASLDRLRDDLPVETRLVLDTSVPRALHTLARDEEAGLIVVGSTARGSAGRVLPGSTAERLLHGAPCPVALATHGYVRAPVQTIAVGFVDSPEGQAALASAHLLATRAGAKLRVIAALHPSGGLDAVKAQGTPPPRAHALEGRHRAAVEAALKRALEALAPGVEVELEIHVEDPADVLLRVSAHVDLLVCGSRGYGPLRSVLLGGVSRRVVDGAQCPVLVLPREARSPLEALLRGTSSSPAAAR
jgi:nucleotide-binding universal stress UspA family protein